MGNSLVRSFAQGINPVALTVGEVMVPAQYCCSDHAQAHNVMTSAVARNQCHHLNVGELNVYMRHGKTSKRATLFVNPNAATVACFFETEFDWTPRIVFDATEDDMFLFDYRGTGTNKLSVETCSTNVEFSTCSQSMVEDCLVVLRHLLDNYDHVRLFGTSLGGAVSACALDDLTVAELNRVLYYNHDSFTSPAQVGVPSLGIVGEWLANACSTNLDAKGALIRAVERSTMKCVVLCHDCDHVIPRNARMANCLSASDQVQIVTSGVQGQYLHGTITAEFVPFIK